MGMVDTDLATDEELRELLKKRYEAKGLAFLFVWGQDDGEAFDMDFFLDDEQIADICDLMLEQGDWDLQDIDEDYDE